MENTLRVNLFFAFLCSFYIQAVFSFDNWYEYAATANLFSESEPLSKVEQEDFCSLLDIPDLNTPDLIFQNISPLRNIEEPAVSSYTITSPDPLELSSLDNVSEFFLATTANTADSILIPSIAAPADEIQPKEKHILPRNKRTHKESPISKCELQGCDQTSYYKHNITKHMKKTHGAQAKPCSQSGCPFRSTIPDAMKRHMENYHPDVAHRSKKIYQCNYPDCYRTTNYASSLNKHMKTHGEDAAPCSMPDCLFKTTSNHGMKKHIETYHPDTFGEHRKLHTCEVQGCDYTNPKKHDVRTHMSTHGEDATPCSRPDCLFKTTSDLAMIKHIKTYHRDTIDEHEILLTCEVQGCDYVTVRKGDLGRHMLTHGDKATFCSQPKCQFRSTMQTALIKHFDKYHKEIPAAPEPTAKRQRTRRS